MRIVSIRRALLAFGACLAIAGCQGFGINEPTPPYLESVEEFLDGTLEVGSSVVVAFEVPKVEYVQITLVGIFTSDPLKPLDVPLSMKLGQFAETGCSNMITTTATPAFAAHQGVVLNPSSYCIEVSDPGTLTEAVYVKVRVVHPAPVAVGQPGTVSASSVMTVGGRASRSFDATVPGAAMITLTDLQPNVEAGLGLGLQQEGGFGCLLTQVIKATPRSTPHFTRQFDPGTYCVEVFDIGNFTRNTTYTLRVQHP